MARAQGRLLSRIWDDEDFVALGPDPQRLFMFLISQRNLNHAGVLPVTLRRWSTKARDLTAERVLACLRVLEADRFVVLDLDQEELLIRTHVRNDEVYKQPRMMGAMVSSALEICSAKLRRALLAELDRLPLDELSDEPGKGDAPSIRTQVEDQIIALRLAFRKDLPPEGPAQGYADPLPDPPDDPLPQGPADDHPKGNAEGSGMGATRVGARDSFDLAPSALGLDLSCAPAGADARQRDAGAKTSKPNPLARFPEFWSVFPLKKGKPAAQKAFAKAVAAGADPQEIIDGARLYAMDCRTKEPKYIKYPQGWLTDGRWGDEPDPQPAAPKVITGPSEAAAALPPTMAELRARGTVAAPPQHEPAFAGDWPDLGFGAMPE